MYASFPIVVPFSSVGDDDPPMFFRLLFIAVQFIMMIFS